MPVSRHTGTFVLYAAFLCFAPVAALAGGNFDLSNDDLFVYDIRTDTGELSDGSWNSDSLSDACDGCWELRIDGTTYNSGNVFTVDPSGRELTLAVQMMSGLEVSRRIYVPQETNFIRHLNILTNTTGGDITVEVAYDTNLGSDSSTTIDGTSSGDLVVTTEDFWVVTDGDSSDPVVAHVWDGIGGTDRADILFVPGSGDDDVDVTWENVTVAAGETVIYMTLGSMSVTSMDAIASANALFNLQSPLTSFNLDEATLLLIRNFAFIDTDEDGMPDGYEIFYGLNPNDASDAASDDDMDGLTALQEFNAFTNPTDSDTDDDGLLDGAEVNDFGTNPNRADTDGDTVFDAGEAFSGLDPLDPDDLRLRMLISDGLGDTASPTAFEDSSGNLHIVYASEVPALPANRGGGGNRQVFYTLLTGGGDVLIGPTQLTDPLLDGCCLNRPEVGANDAGIVYVTWQDSSQLSLKVLDVSADDQDGSPADIAVIGPTAPRSLSVDSVHHSAIAVDSAGNGHIGAEQRCSGIRYYKVGPDGLDIFPEVQITASTCHATVDLTLDSDDNVHLVYSSDRDPAGTGLSAYGLFYGMLSGVDGSILIEPTVLTPDDGNRAKHSTITIDDSDMAHVIWGNALPDPDPVRGGGGNNGEVFYTKLDPSLDDQSGDAASAAAITVVPMTMLTEDDGRQSWYVESRRVGDAIQITWIDSGGNGSAPAYHMRLALADGSTSAPQLLSTSARQETNNNYAPVAGDRVLLKEDVGGVTSVISQRLFAAPVQTATATGLASVDAAGGIPISLEALNLADLPAAAQADALRGISFVDGLFRMVINTDTPGGTVMLTLNLPTAVDAQTVYPKWDAVNGWTFFPYSAGTTANSVVLTLIDGGAGDADGVANGQIVDPGGPGTNTNTAPVFNSAPVQTGTVSAAYSYTVAVSDANAGDTLTLAATTLPAWLTFVDNGGGSGTLTGTPPAANAGANPVVIRATDNAAIPATVNQSFTVTVAANAVPVNVTGSGGGSGATAPWMLLLGAGLLFIRSRRTQKGAQ